MAVFVGVVLGNLTDCQSQKSTQQRERESFKTHKNYPRIDVKLKVPKPTNYNTVSKFFFSSSILLRIVFAFCNFHNVFVVYDIDMISPTFQQPWSMLWSCLNAVEAAFEAMNVL